MNAKDGGPAFPVPNTVAWNQKNNTAVTGMTLRDYFAGQALLAIAANTLDESPYYEAMPASTVACMAYELADAMLATSER
jgi:hypothetical protein